MDLQACCVLKVLIKILFRLFSSNSPYLAKARQFLLPRSFYHLLFFEHFLLILTLLLRLRPAPFHMCARIRFCRLLCFLFIFCILCLMNLALLLRKFGLPSLKTHAQTCGFTAHNATVLSSGQRTLNVHTLLFCAALSLQVYLSALFLLHRKVSQLYLLLGLLLSGILGNIFFRFVYWLCGRMLDTNFLFFDLLVRYFFS